MVDLRHLQVLITRPLEQAREWERELRGLGADTALLPVMSIEPVSEPAELQRVKERMMALADYQKVVFVSRNAVQHAWEWIDRYWPQLPAHIRYFAVGSATASAASEYGLHVEAAGEAMNSEALLRLPALQSVAHEKILICRGRGGRDFLAENLRARGAQVDFCELYHRRLPEAARGQLADFLRTRQHSEAELVLAAHSGESLENLNRLIGDLSVGDQALLRGSYLLVPGERAADLARSLGFDRVIAALNATDAVMTETLGQIPARGQ